MYLHATPVRRTARTDPGDAEVLLNRSKENVADIRANTNWYARALRFRFSRFQAQFSSSVKDTSRC